MRLSDQQFSLVLELLLPSLEAVVALEKMALEAETNEALSIPSSCVPLVRDERSRPNPRTGRDERSNPDADHAGTS